MNSAQVQDRLRREADNCHRNFPQIASFIGVLTSNSRGVVVATLPFLVAMSQGL